MREKITPQDYLTTEKPQWCPGCGDFGILIAVKKALVELNLDPKDVVIVSGIGCGSKIPHYIRAYGYEGIHGRLIPLAEGIKLANPDLTVIVIGGDGDGFSEGGNHFLHAARKNSDITYLVQDNQVYGLTTGQASPTTHKGMKTKTTPEGAFLPEFRPIPIALASKASFVAATFAGDLNHMVKTIKKGIMHKGFSFIDIYQPCVTWNYINTYNWWKERVYDLQENGHDPNSYLEAYKKSLEPYETDWEKVPIGIFFEEERPTLNDIVSYGNLMEKSKKIEVDISKDLEEFI